MHRFAIAPRSLRIVIGLLALFVLSSCAIEPPMYQWGSYEDVIYAGYRNRGSSDPITDANMLAADIARAESEGKRVPPGVRVHLGYLYFNEGRDSEARALFEMERDNFPESKVFIDGLLSRMGAAQ